MRKILLTLFICSILLTNTTAQENRLGNSPTSSSEIFHKLEKLGFLGSALFIAAHPDDENTRLISYLDNDVMARTAYLSLTRGDGGQNLIGPQLREQLGMIRTQELLEARNIDGGEQFFTRANDFGYSKDPKETLEIWDKDQVLADVVQIIRKFKPDVIINRFDHRTAGTTHGHHTSSAILSVEAFEMAADKTAFPAQLELTDTWDPQRLFFNTSPWFYGSNDAFAKADKTNLYQVESGRYFTFNGYSNGEIAALSRSRHQSQGFGSSGSRGNSTEYLELLKGSRPSNKNNIFSGINTTWTRVDGGKDIMSSLQKVLKNYDFKNPSLSLNNVIALRTKVKALDNSYWKNIKLSEIDDIIKDLIGLYARAYVDQPYATAGESIDLHIEIANRSLDRLNLVVGKTPYVSYSNTVNTISKNTSVTMDGVLNIPLDVEPTTPYYLKKEGGVGMYTVDEPTMIGMPEASPAFHVPIILKFETDQIDMSLPVIYKTTDRVRGEIYEPFNVVPSVAVSIKNPVYIYSNNEQKEIQVNIKAFKDITGLTLFANIPENWIQPMVRQQQFSMFKGESKTFTFKVTSPDESSQGDIEVYAMTANQKFDEEVINIDYNHIPDQQLLKPAKARLVNPGLKNLAQSIAYINGAGDDVATAIEAIGGKVTKFEPSEVPANLSKYDAVVVGIRAYNVAPEDMAGLQSSLKSYVESGGTLIMQYNTDRGISKNALGPLPISLSRKRVTDENAAVTFLAPDNKVLNFPNTINPDDFNGWVQERGLYFPDSWDPAFVPILGMSDQGEEETTGSLIVAPYGKGYVVYTGLSLFRELPAGVSGAYKLLANMISLSKN